MRNSVKEMQDRIIFFCTTVIWILPTTAVSAKYSSADLYISVIDDSQLDDIQQHLLDSDGDVTAYVHNTSNNQRVKF